MAPTTRQITPLLHLSQDQLNAFNAAPASNLPEYHSQDSPVMADKSVPVELEIMVDDDNDADGEADEEDEEEEDVVAVEEF
ncbi:hypothetical protein DFQ30_004037 [Apophysomyces sp. BC1015]|nr:hypothetical protein DFQ30_004037 [Apophysomyces sp. BC1015]